MSHTHTYRTELAWAGSTGAGYEAYPRAHELRAAPAEAGLALSSDPAFRGELRAAAAARKLVAMS